MSTQLSPAHNLAPHLSQYQHFLTLKSKSFQPSACLCYNSEFCLKLAIRHCRYRAVGHGYACGSITHLYAACLGTRTPPYPNRGPPPTLLPAPRGNSRSHATSLTTRGVVEAPTSTPAHTAGVSTPSSWGSSRTSTLPSTVRPLLLARFLHEHPNQQFVSTLLSHLTHGFDIGYQSPHRDTRAPNLPSAAVHPEAVTDYLRKECSAGRMAGPFPRRPSPHFTVLVWVWYPSRMVPGG